MFSILVAQLEPLLQACLLIAGFYTKNSSEERIYRRYTHALGTKIACFDFV